MSNKAMPEMVCPKCGHIVQNEGAELEFYVILKMHKESMPFIHCPDCKEDIIPNPFKEAKC